jgi:prephenate dehydrogenase
MKQWNAVAIVGVGLIGGSVGLALRRRGLAREVIGIGRRQQSLAVAQQVGAVTQTSLDLSAAAAAELIVVCTPVGRIAADLEAVAAHCRPGTLLTDAGSTKSEIVAAVDGKLPDGVAFVGSHPLAGSERSGPAAADAELFVDRTIVLTPAARSREADIRTLTEFWTSLGARVTCMTPHDHDRALAATSHLPHLVAAALASATATADLPLTAGGWADTTRIAAGDPELWTQIFLSNQRHLLAALDEHQKAIDSLRRAVEHGDRERLLAMLADAKQRRDAIDPRGS